IYGGFSSLCDINISSQRVYFVVVLFFSSRHETKYIIEFEIHRVCCFDIVFFSSRHETKYIIEIHTRNCDTVDKTEDERLDTCGLAELALDGPSTTGTGVTGCGPALVRMRTHCLTTTSVDTKTGRTHIVYSVSGPSSVTLYRFRNGSRTVCAG
ncbi:hypothetical protein EGW08_020963, partial [Elysia chlorotica]